jgi:hypothetical protein
MNVCTYRGSWPLLAMAGMGCFLACAPKSVVKANASTDSALRRIYLAPFEGDTGSVIRKAMGHALLDKGVTLVDRPQRADAVLLGTVVEYNPEKKLMVFLGNANAVSPNGQTQPVSNPVVTTNTNLVTAQGLIQGQENMQIASGIASVVVSLRLQHNRNGAIVWVDEYGYEGLDIQRALQVVAGTLAQSLQRALSQFKKES